MYVCIYTYHDAHAHAHAHEWTRAKRRFEKKVIKSKEVFRARRDQGKKRENMKTNPNCKKLQRGISGLTRLRATGAQISSPTAQVLHTHSLDIFFLLLGPDVLDILTSWNCGPGCYHKRMVPECKPRRQHHQTTKEQHQRGHSVPCYEATMSRELL